MEWLDYEINLGIAEFAREAGWMVDDVVSHTGQPPELWEGEGILALLRKREGEVVRFVTAQLDGKRGVPVVDMVSELADIQVPRVLADNQGIGAAAAEHLLACGLHHLAFFNLWDSQVEQERMAGFRDTVVAAGKTFHELSFHGHKRPDSTSPAILGWLQEKLAALPKPLGVMGQHDREAMYVIQACELAGLKIPDEVAVVGSDNDPLLCDLGLIPLSSVDNRRRDQGYRAAELLDGLMNGEKAPKEPIRVPAGPVIVRYSSEVLAVPDPDLAQALKFIADHYSQPIDVQQVVDHVNTNRRRLYMLFQQHLGRPIHAEILRRRLEMAKRLLLTTDNKLYAIARACGFLNAQQLTRVFTRELGVSPSKMRSRREATASASAE